MTASTPTTSTATNAPTSLHTRTLLECATQRGFTTFGKAVTAAGLADTLNGAGPFTVFAPSDAAFQALPAGTLDRLLKPEHKDELAAVLTYHVVSGRVSGAELGKLSTTATVNGQPAPVSMDHGKVAIGGATVTEADIGARNGVLHAIDKVMLPTAKASNDPVTPAPLPATGTR